MRSLFSTPAKPEPEAVGTPHDVGAATPTSTPDTQSDTAPQWDDEDEAAAQAVRTEQPNKIRTADRPEKGQEQQLHVRATRTKGKAFARRVGSELALEQELDWHWEKGTAYHCITWGDVDSLTFLRAGVKQQRLEHVTVATWVMAYTDVLELELWLQKGYVGHLDVYLGEFFRSSYPVIYDKLQQVVRDHGGRVAVFRNHSKVIVGFGENFDFVVESSANMNTNPRTENFCVTVDSELATFYKDYYDGINAFNRDFPEWEPYKLKRQQDETIQP